MWKVTLKQNQNQTQINPIDYKTNNQRKHSIGQDQANGRLKMNQGQMDNFNMQLQNKNSTNINNIKVIENVSDSRFNKEQNINYPIEEDVKNIIVGDYNSMFISGENTARSNQSPFFNSNQKSSQNFYQWGTESHGTTNYKFQKRNSPSDSKRKRTGSSNAGLFTSTKFYQKKLFNNHMNKSHSISFMQGSFRNNISRNEHGNSYQNSITGMPMIEKARSINDFLHRNYISLNLQQSMAQMDQITQETMKQQQQQLQQEQLQKLKEISKQQEQLNTKPQQGNFQNTQNKQYFVQIQKQLQAQQDQNFTPQQKNTNQDVQTQPLENGYQSVSLDKSQDDQANNLQNNQRQSTQQSQHSLQLKTQSSKEQQALSQSDYNSKSEIQQKTTESVKINASSEKLPSQQRLNLPQLNQPQPEDIKNLHDSNSDIYSTNSHLKPINIVEQQLQSSFNNTTKKSIDKNIFSLTGSNTQVRNRLPYQDVLSLCNQNQLDNLTSQRKSFQIEQKIEQKQQYENQLDRQYNSIKKMDGLEGVSIQKDKNQIKSQKHLTNTRFETDSKFRLEMQFHTDRKQYKHNLKSEFNENLSPFYKLNEQSKNQVNSDRLHIPLVLKIKNNRDTWKESHFFKLNKNFEQFTLKQLKGSLNNINFNPDGSSTQWRYYLQDTVKQSNYIQNINNNKQQKVQIKGKQNYETEGQNLDSSMQDEEQDQIYNFEQFEKEIKENDHKQTKKDEKNKNELKENTSFYKMLKKQNVNPLDNNNISSYDIIDDQFDKIFQTHFQKNLAIRKVDMVYNIKHLAILKYKREMRLLAGSQDPDDLLDYIQKKNKIQILLHNAKKIKNLQQVAELIESKINLQNDRINSVVDDLLIKFDINQQQ